jgi:hypothetical protein
VIIEWSYKIETDDGKIDVSMVKDDDGNTRIYLSGNGNQITLDDFTIETLAKTLEQFKSAIALTGV